MIIIIVIHLGGKLPWKFPMEAIPDTCSGVSVQVCFYGNWISVTSVNTNPREVAHRERVGIWGVSREKGVGIGEVEIMIIHRL